MDPPHPGRHRRLRGGQRGQLPLLSLLLPLQHVHELRGVSLLLRMLQEQRVLAHQEQLKKNSQRRISKKKKKKSALIIMSSKRVQLCLEEKRLRQLGFGCDDYLESKGTPCQVPQ